MEQVCKDLDIPTKSNRVDLGVRVELPAVIFPISPMGCMRARSFTAQKNLKTTCGLSA